MRGKTIAAGTCNVPIDAPLLPASLVFCYNFTMRLVFRLLLLAMAGLSTSAFAALPDPHSLADRYKSSLQQMRSEDDLVQFVSKKIAPDFGLASTLVSFSNDLTNGHYSKQMQQLINMPVMKWNGNWGMLERYELEDMQRIVNKNAAGTGDRADHTSARSTR